MAPPYAGAQRRGGPGRWGGRAPGGLAAGAGVWCAAVHTLPGLRRGRRALANVRARRRSGSEGRERAPLAGPAAGLLAALVPLLAGSASSSPAPPTALPPSPVAVTAPARYRLI